MSSRYILTDKTTGEIIEPSRRWDSQQVRRKPQSRRKGYQRRVSAPDDLTLALIAYSVVVTVLLILK